MIKFCALTCQRNAAVAMNISRSLFIFFVLVLCCCAGRAQEKPQLRSLRAQVLAVQDPAASEAFRAKPDVVRAMVDRGLTNLTSQPNLAEAWRSLVSTQDTVGIKVFSVPGPYSGTRPAVVAAVIEWLIAAGLPPKSIVVWDKHITDLRLAGFS